MSVASNNKMKMGDQAPAFAGLPGVDGKTYGLTDFSSDKILVVFFSCNHCPYVQAYEERIKRLQREFREAGVQFVAINSNDSDNYSEDSFENMVKRAKDRAFNFIYLRDESQEVAKSYGATHTPHLYVFDQNRALAYTGRIDDNWQEEDRVKKQYLHDALTALLQGEKPEQPETFAIGCTIKWKN